MKNIKKYYYNSPIGLMEFMVRGDTLSYLNFCMGRCVSSENDTSFSKKVKKQLDEYFLRMRKTFDLDIKIDATPFQKDVLDEIAKIPYGKTLTYGEIASELGNKNASRAVGSACNMNPILIIIPCHRVVSKNGLGGYSAGLENKKYLLSLETN